MYSREERELLGKKLQLNLPGGVGMTMTMLPQDTNEPYWDAPVFCCVLKPTRNEIKQFDLRPCTFTVTPFPDVVWLTLSVGSAYLLDTPFHLCFLPHDAEIRRRMQGMVWRDEDVWPLHFVLVDNRKSKRLIRAIRPLGADGKFWRAFSEMLLELPNDPVAARNAAYEGTKRYSQQQIIERATLKLIQ